MASQFSLSTGEEYTDNLFFSKNKEHDFVTIITPTLSLFYAPVGQAVPTLNLNISPSGQIYGQHSDLNSFGFKDGSNVNGGYTFQYSPRLTFNFSDNFQMQGQTRLTGLLGEGGGQLPLTPTTPFPTGAVAPSSSQNLKSFVSGEQLSNHFAFQGNFLLRPDLTFSGGYSNTYAKFITEGGTDFSQNFSIRGIYNWKQEHNLHAGYSISIVNPRNGDNGVIHNFDFGDDYFTNQVYKVQITPTLSLAGSTGLSINTSNSGPRVANNTALTVTKLWETATFSAGVRKGLTPTFGVSGVSDTTSVFANFNIQLAERILGSAGTDFSYYDTKDVNFKTFQVWSNLQYLISPWLSAGLAYSYRMVDSGAGADNTDLLSKGTVRSNNVFLNLTTRFDIWPNTGLARTQPFSSGSPVIRTPFPIAPPTQTPSGQPTS